MSSKPLLIAGGQVLVASGATVAAQTADICIDNDIIVAIDKHIAPQNMYRVIDARGLVVIPGFVQAHVHVCQTLWRHQANDMSLLPWLQDSVWPMEAALDRDTLQAAARLGMAELLLGGTTSILDMGTVHHTDVLFEEAQRIGIRYTGGKTIMDVHSGPLRENAADALQESVRLCKRWHGQASDRLRYAFAPRFAVSCSAYVLQHCATLARTHQTLLHTHASENQDEINLIHAQTGMRNVAYLNSLGCTGSNVVLAHGIWLSHDELCILRDTGTWIVHCPSSNLKLASGIANIPQLLAQGVQVALGADGAPCNNNLDAFMEMRLAALLHKVSHGPTSIPAHVAFNMATRAGALALHQLQCGSIAVGQKADLVLLDLNKPHVFPNTGDLVARIVYAARAQDVHTVLVNGHIVVDHATLCNIEISHVLAEAQSAALVLQDKVKLTP